MFLKFSKTRNRMDSLWPFTSHLTNHPRSVRYTGHYWSGKDTRCSREDLPRTMTDKNGEREREREWKKFVLLARLNDIYIYIYICVCVFVCVCVCVCMYIYIYIYIMWSFRKKTSDYLFRYKDKINGTVII